MKEGVDKGILSIGKRKGDALQAYQPDGNESGCIEKNEKKRRKIKKCEHGDHA